MKLHFTGEWMIPDVNKNAALYFEHINRNLFASTLVKRKTVLDLGSGSGYGSYLLSKAGANRVDGVDNSKDALKYSNNKYKLEGKIVFIKEKEKETERSRKILNEITSAKTFRIWQSFVAYRSKIGNFFR